MSNTIDEGSLLSFAHFFRDERQLEKDYIANLMLKVISVNKLSTSLEFKGGTALYMFHSLDRFSEDLDFSYIGRDKDMSRQIDSYLKPIFTDFGLSYNISKNKGNVLTRNAEGAISGIRTELFIEGPLFGRTGTRHKLKIDISFRNDAIMKPEIGRIVSRYPDVGTILIYKMPLEEILAEKLCAILERQKARDIYDVYFMLKFNEANFNSGLLEEKLEKRGEERNKGPILKNINEFKEGLWKEELYYTLKVLPNLSEVKRFLKSKIS